MRRLHRGLLGIAAALLLPVSAAQAAATFNVTKQTDSNDGACTATKCSLRDAVIASNAVAGPNVINLRGVDYKLTIPGVNEDAAATGDLDVLKSVTIKGVGPAESKIDATHIDRVFEMLSGAKLSLSGVTVTGGLADSTATGSIHAGGAVLDQSGGDLSITNSALTGNSASGGSAGGGAIEITGASNGALTMTGSTATNNQSGGSNSSDNGYGGVIRNEGTGMVTLSRVTMTTNHAGGAGAGGYGGVLNTTASVNVSSSTFANNTAGGLGGYGYGGALNVNTATITDSAFRSNIAGQGSGSGFGYGGAIESGTSTTLTRSVLTNNVAGGGTNNYGYGGGIDSLTGAVTLTDSNVSGNTAGGGGGFGYGGGVVGVVTATGSTISNNRAGGGGEFGYGGGINAETGSSTLTNTTVSGNTAGGGSGVSPYGYGGGINEFGTLTLNFSDVVGNSAATVLPNQGGGGGVSGTLTSKDSIVANNAAAVNGANCNNAATSQGHNLENGTSCGFTGTGDLNASVSFAPLANNGGLTPTLRLLSGSPAINHGDVAGCPATDQRGVHRPVGPACDIGSYEVSAAPVAVTSGAKIGHSHHVSLSGSATNPDVVAATAFFQVGKTTAYGLTSASQPVAALASGHAFKSSLGKLKAGTLYHYRAVVRTPDGVGLGADKTFRTPKPPKLSKVHVKRSRSGGFSVSYTDSQAGTVTFTVLRHGKKVRSFKHSGKAGHHTVKFGNGLPSGSYKLKVVAHNSFGSKSHAVIKGFRVR